MATTIYVTNPQLTTPGLPDELLLCYTIHVCADGSPSVPHAPCGEETLVTVAFGESAGAIQTKIVANLLAHFPEIGQNDIIFLPQIGTGA